MRIPLLSAAAVIGVLTTSQANAQLPGAGMGAQMLERVVQMDLNKDGAVSKDEARAARLAQFAKLDANKDGAIDASERPTDREARRFTAADADGDGKVTQAEWLNAPYPLFDRFDANHDGVIDAQELGKLRQMVGAR